MLKKRPLIFVGSRFKINELAWTADCLGHPVLGVLDHQYMDQPSRCALPVLGDERWLADPHNQLAQQWLRDCDFFVGSIYYGEQQRSDDAGNMERLRYQRTRLLDQVGATVVNLIHPDTGIEQRLSNPYCTDLNLGKGIYISWSSDIQPLGVTLGDYCSLETGCFVGHGSVLGRNVALMPYAWINKGTIGDNACIGTQARTDKPSRMYHVGAWSTVYYNSVIDRDIPDNSVFTPHGVIKPKRRSLDWI